MLKDILESETSEKDVLYSRYNQSTMKEKSAALGTNPQCETSKTGQVVISHSNIEPVEEKDYQNNIYSVRGNQVSINGKEYKIDLPDGDYTVRKLTTVECERLQTWPDGYSEGVSKTQRYKMIGNGWTADVIAHIFSFMEKAEDENQNPM